MYSPIADRSEGKFIGFTQYYSVDYSTARRRFLEAAAGLCTTVQSYPFPGLGPDWESLAMDVASIGDPNAQRVVIVSSGLHGVEGFFGSAIQLAWMRQRGPDWMPKPGTRIVLVHAMNPFGFAWRRRWNENNVDLNRNFLESRSFIETDPSYHESRDAYERLAAMLNPASPPSRWEPYSIKAILHILTAGFRAIRRRQPHQPFHSLRIKTIWELGILDLQKSLPVGQYEHPRGLFYGGAEPERTVRLVRECLPGWVGSAGDVVHLDFHSGLGKFAEYRLLLIDEKGSSFARQAAETFGDDVVEPADGRTSYNARGLMAANLRDRLPDCRYQCLTAELGTHGVMRVLGALRAENRAHFFGNPASASDRWAKQQVMDAFCPADSRWRNEAVSQGLKIIDQAITQSSRAQ